MASSGHAAMDALSPERTLEELARGTVVRWWQVSAFIEVAGPDAPTLLDGLCTQAVERIAPGTAVLGLFLDPKARIIAPAILHRSVDAPWRDARRDEVVEAAPRLLLETLPELVEPLRAHLGRYRLRARASIEARDLGSVALVGDALADADSPVELATDPPGDWSHVLGEARTTRAFIGEPAACAALVRSAVLDHGIGLADADAVEADRIERGLAGLHDLLVGRMPAEVGGMERAVALDAGCYLGQEPVARLHYRGRANRTLRRVTADRPISPPVPAGSSDLDAEPPALDDVLALRHPDAAPDARPVGRLTTWAPTPDGGCVALAIVRREVARGEMLRWGDDLSVVVADDAAVAPAP